MFSLLTTAAALGAAAQTALRSLRRYDVRDKVVLITGGSRGLGLAMARVLHEKGAKLALCARDAAELDRVRAELGDRVFTGHCDVTSDEQVEAFVRDAVRALGPVDVLIANAATISVGPLASHGAKDYQRALDETFWGAYRATMAVLPSMQERRAGRIVHIASFGGKVAVPHVVPYCVGKFALEGLSQGMRAELLRDGVYVTTVSPGLMRTGSHLNAEFKGDPALEFFGFSLGLALRFGSLSAEVAAERIVQAMIDGDAELVLGWPAKLLSMAHGVAPNLLAEVIGLVARVLPAEAGQTTAVRGAEVRDQAPLQPVIDSLDGIAAKYNELS